ncbi:MAG: glycerol kinase GlpK [Geobacter sp.]|nr:glycerol kinase GlpK [Geobacter sp.]
MSFLLALDQGTTSSRAIIFNHSAEIVSIAQQELPQHYPQPGWVEQDARDILNSQLSVAHRVLAQAGLSAGDLAAIGITNQRETTLVWERTSGTPIANAIVWQDRRTADLCERLQQEGREPLFQEKTGLLLDPYFSGTKLAWLLNNVPGARVRAEKGELLFGTVDSWLLWHLTNGARHLTDISNASRTLLFNIHTCDWDNELLEVLNIPRAMLPEIAESSERYGDTATGLFSAPIPITGMAGDQQAALFGQGCSRPGLVKNTYGTGCFMLKQTGTTLVRSANRLLTTVAWQLNGQVSYALEGSVFSAGAAVQWLRDGLGIISTAAEIEQLALQTPDSGGACLVPAFTGLGAPHWDPHARGILAGISPGTGRAEIARACLEGIALQTVDLVRAMEADTGISLPELRVDGGATANNLLMQLQADLLGIPVVRARTSETTALGAAFLAGLAVGYWSGSEELELTRRIDRVFEPHISRDKAEAMHQSWQQAVLRAKAWQQ